MMGRESGSEVQAELKSSSRPKAGTAKGAKISNLCVLGRGMDNPIPGSFCSAPHSSTERGLPQMTELL